MNCIDQIQQQFFSFIKTQFSLDDSFITTSGLTINVDESKKDFGDLSSNIPMVIARPLKRNPKEIAAEILQKFTHPLVAKIEIAGPGFLNFFLTPQAFQDLAIQLWDQKDQFFVLDEQAPRHHFNVEFVSGNPTGPLHLGHGRNGIIGDVLSTVLKFLGHDVVKEYYINDAGSQIQKLGQSFKIRCQQQAGMLDAQIPEGGYQGEYLVELAKKLITEQGPAILDQPDSFFADYAKTEMLKNIRETLAEYGMHFDVWFSEQALHDDGSINRAIDLLRTKGFVYDLEGAVWFKSTAFGDDKDRVLRKANGEVTYVAPDIAYMQNKIARGADKLVMVLGHDHHSYVTRLQALLTALDLGPATLEVILYQLVNLKASGEIVKMSKRAGKIVNLSDVIETVGVDVARFFFLNRKAETPLDFDLDLALKRSEENPVFYVQYAFVRTTSILGKAAAEEKLQAITAADAQHLGEPEAQLIKKIIDLKYILRGIGNHYQTHLLAYYVLELAHSFHSYYSKNRVIDLENIPVSRARLLLIMELQHAFGLALKLLGLSRPEKM
jgi:arginyl-tRNA synthetase